MDLDPPKLFLSDRQQCVPHISAELDLSLRLYYDMSGGVQGGHINPECICFTQALALKQVAGQQQSFVYCVTAALGTYLTIGAIS